MQIVIVDDEKTVRDMLEEKINRIYPDMDIHSYQSGKDFLQAKDDAEIILLDIQMPEIDGMETARYLRAAGNTSVIIFITGIEEYVFQAFDVKAFHYLVKPFSDEKFVSVISSAVEYYQKKTEAAFRNLEESIVIKNGGEYNRIAIKDIIYAEVFNRKVIIHQMSGKIEYYGKMGELEKQLGENFFRSHRSYLVHFRYVEKYNSTIIFLQKEKVLMAKQRYPEFVKKYIKYVQRKGKK